MSKSKKFQVTLYLNLSKYQPRVFTGSTQELVVASVREHLKRYGADVCLRFDRSGDAQLVLLWDEYYSQLEFLWATDDEAAYTDDEAVEKFLNLVKEFIKEND